MTNPARTMTQAELRHAFVTRLSPAPHKGVSLIKAPCPGVSLVKVPR